MRRPFLPAIRPFACLLLLSLALAGCSGRGGGEDEDKDEGDLDGSPERTMSITSASFGNGTAIPPRHTCDGEEVSPPLLIAGLPEATVSVALTVKDPDVPTPAAPAYTITHWVVWNLTPEPAVVFPEGQVPPEAREGANPFGHGWLGPCPPETSPPHRYNFTAFALDNRPELPDNATRDQLEAAMAGHVLAQATLVGTYERQLA